MIGLETLFATVGQQLRSKNDVMLTVIHCNLIQSGFRCVGIGETFSETPETGSELLPKNWNSDVDTYVLRYASHNKKLLLKCVKVGDVLIVSALQIPGEPTGTSLTLRADDYISNNYRDFKTAFIDNSSDLLSQVLNKEIISKLDKSEATRASTQRQSNEERTRNPVPEPSNPSFTPPHRYPSLLEERRFPPAVGGADLDPLGRSEGGMLMDPRQFPPPFGGNFNPSAGLPRPLPFGAVPPGARFDPFGPPAPNPRPNQMPRNPRNPPFGNPDPDHLPPPGYDDMFN